MRRARPHRQSTAFPRTAPRSSLALLALCCCYCAASSPLLCGKREQAVCAHGVLQSPLSHLKGCVASSKVHRQHNDRMRKAGAGAVAVRHARLEEEEPTNAGGDFSAANGSHLFSIESPTSQDGPGVCACVCVARYVCFPSHVHCCGIRAGRCSFGA